MKATLWLWLAGTALVCMSLQVSALPYSDTRMIQDNSLLSLKRTKPSLSIVNPLDVLRQRIILEMARRQMRENTRQVELNKALLREIGKRSSNFYDGLELEAPSVPVGYGYYDRKPYGQRAPAVDLERTEDAEDELEAMMESLLRSSGGSSSSQPRHAGKPQPQHVRSVSSGRQQPQQHSPSQPSDQPMERKQPSNSFFSSNEPAETNLQVKGEAGTVDGEPTEDEVADVQGQEVDDGERFLDASQTGPLKADGRMTGTDRAGEGEGSSSFRPRYVYGLYKNRYAN